MRPHSFAADLMLGLAALALAFLLFVAASYGLSTLTPSLGPVIANVLWGAALIALLAAGIQWRRSGLAVAPVAFLALWAAGAQVHAGLVTAETGPRDGLTSVPDVRPVTTLIVKASYGLPVDPSRTGGTTLARYDECGPWCRDLILDKGLAAVVLRTPKPNAPTQTTLFRKGSQSECADKAAPCLVDVPIDDLPDGLMIEMGDEAGPETEGGLCCPVAVVSRMQSGEKTVIKSYRQGGGAALMPLPVITAAGKPFKDPPVMMREVALGPVLRFDTLIEALLDTELRWK